MRIYKKEAKQIILGASWFATGGGFPLNQQERLVDEIFVSKSFVTLKVVDNFKDNELICAAYGVGSAARTDVNLIGALKKAIVVMEGLVGRKISGFFGAETGIESMIFELCQKVDLPIVDADCTGGRAVPEISIDNFFVLGKQITPIVAVNLNLETLIIDGNHSGEYIESKVRLFSKKSRGSVAVLDHAVKIKDAKKSLTLSTISRSLKLGEKLTDRNKNHLNYLLADLSATLKFEGKITEILLKDDQSGFLIGSYKVTNDKQQATILVKNENLLLTIDNQSITSCPDLIISVDKNNLVGLHNSQLKKGRDVFIISLPATKLWCLPKSKKIFNWQRLCLSNPGTG